MTDGTEGSPGPECKIDSDCTSSSEGCENGRCIDHWDDCNYYEDLDGCPGEDTDPDLDTDSGPDTDDELPGECELDIDCAFDQWCSGEGSRSECAALPIPVPCEGEPLTLTFMPVFETSDDILRFELAGPPGDEMIVLVSSNAIDGARTRAVSVASGAALPVPLAQAPSSVTGGDLDGDGDTDLVTGRQNVVSVFEQVAEGAFELRSELEMGGTAWVGVAGTDGANAAVLATRDGRVFRADPVSPFVYAGAEPITPKRGSVNKRVVVGDFDGIGWEDIAWAPSNNAETQLHTFRLGRGVRPSFASRPGAAMHRADGDSDGVDDLVVVGSSERGPGRSRVDVVLPVFPLDGAGRAVFDHVGFTTQSSTAADVDGDGAADAVLLLWDDGDGAASLLLGRQLLGEVACASTLPLEGSYETVQALQHADGSGWLVVQGPEGFLAAPL